MASLQGSVYGHSDCWGIPFDLYSGATSLPSGSTINMQTGFLVLNPASAVSVTINLPLNPPDGAVAEITNSSGYIVTLSAVNANTGDSLVQAAAPATLAAQTAGQLATTRVRYKYSLNGLAVGNTVINARSWFRVE